MLIKINFSRFGLARGVISFVTLVKYSSTSYIYSLQLASQIAGPCARGSLKCNVDVKLQRLVL